ncbi:DeoR/GlpR family DNA-binding transcription regulator [Labrys monachus]|uniref:DeoR/GlpR family transcriptional regulator of sugar metabolism n=1 Tax=Labrys monachus TaxID=217067 RepID=A0ABU0FKZ1_9HYPH|nr:DeoR/GlpR family DNA-binding transcription regulator [Labrys monachus]MDQ0395027.1 DeoR/GlpR family transcriptional regulator of sugar metabolism [Labrys monachus]
MDAPAKRVEIIPAKRRAMILEHLRINGAASIQELAEAIGGSQSTIRRDLEQLMEGGYLERTHGGALLVPPLQATFERESAINAHLQRAQKIAIGIEAAQRLNTRESVIFESSSTVMEAARAALTRDLTLTVVTNSLDIALLASGVPSWRVIMPGGTIRPGGWRALTGEPGESFFQTVHADLCFTGAYAVTGNLLTDAALEVASLKRAMIRSARRTIALVDSSKFTAPAFSTFCDLSAIDELITDDGILPEHLASLRSYNVKVTVVPVRDVPEAGLKRNSG